MVGAISGIKEETVLLGNYSDLYQYNAYLLDGHTVHRSSTTIPVYGVTGGDWRKAIKRWPIVNFGFVSTEPAREIHIMGYDDLGNICGIASFTYDSTGALELFTVKVNVFYDDMNWLLHRGVQTHHGWG